VWISGESNQPDFYAFGHVQNIFFYLLILPLMLVMLLGFRKGYVFPVLLIAF
jgi:hypothetical protein